MSLPLTKQFLFNLFNFWLDTCSVSSSHSRWKSIGKVFCGNIDDFLADYTKKHGARKLANCIGNLKRAGLITASKKEIRNGVIITPKGLNLLRRLGGTEKSFSRRGDGKMLMVIFDIAESRRKIRDVFRHQLAVLGYEQLQKSVWMSSYQVLRETEALLDDYNLRNSAFIFLVDQI